MKYFTVLLLYCFLAVLVGGCRKQNVSTKLQASGTLEMTEVYLSPAVTGRVATLTVQEGDRVRAGQRVGTLHRFEQSERDHARLERLLPEGGATREQVENARLAWEDQQVVASIEGVVLLRVSEPGESVAPGIPVVVIGNPRDMWIKVYVSEREIGRVRLGQTAQIAIDSFPGRFFPGKVTFISPKAEFTPKNIQTKEERVTQMFAVKVSVAPTDEGLLKPGLPADCAIDVGH